MQYTSQSSHTKLKLRKKHIMKLFIAVLFAFATHTTSYPQGETGTIVTAPESARTTIQCAGVSDDSTAYCVFLQSHFVPGRWRIQCAANSAQFEGNERWSGRYVERNGEVIDWRRDAFGRDFVDAVVNQRNSSHREPNATIEELIAQRPQLGEHARCSFQGGRADCTGGLWKGDRYFGRLWTIPAGERVHKCVRVECTGAGLYSYRPIALAAGEDHSCNLEYKKRQRITFS